MINQIVAAAVPVSLKVRCEADEDEGPYLKMLDSVALSDRYTGAKALGFLGSKKAQKALQSKLGDEREHVYVRTEAAAGLARNGTDQGYSFIEGLLADEYLQNRLEALIVLAELGSARSARSLIAVLRDLKQHPELRAGAAWGLGEMKSKEALEALISSFAEVEPQIRTEAARALAKLSESLSGQISGRLGAEKVEWRAGIAWALGRATRLHLEELLEAARDEDARHWVSYVVGSHDPREFVEQLESLKVRDPEVYFAATVLWKIMNSWIARLEEYG